MTENEKSKGSVIEPEKRRLHLWLIIFCVCFFFTIVLWDHYFDSELKLNREVISHLILAMGTIFSAAAALFSWTIETRRNDLEKMVKKRTEELEAQNKELITAFKEIKVLHGIFPICASCKKIRNDEGYWQQIEMYLHEHAEVKFSHGLCEECIQIHHPDYWQRKQAKPTKNP